MPRRQWRHRGVDHAGAGHRDHTRFAAELRAPLEERAGVDPAHARYFIERLALALQGAILLRAGSPVADAFCRSWLGGEHGLAMGTLPAGLPLAALINRLLPPDLSTSG